MKSEKQKRAARKAALEYYWKNRDKCLEKGREWRKNNKEKHRAIMRRWADDHRKEKREYDKKYKKENRQRLSLAQKERTAKARMEMIKIYSGKCECCGENRYEFLAIDHINGGGRTDPNVHWGGGSVKQYKFLMSLGYPNGIYRLLCHNCNLARGFYGYCPHEKEKQHEDLSKINPADVGPKSS